jgi:hypothetical protein
MLLQRRTLLVCYLFQAWKDSAVFLTLSTVSQYHQYAVHTVISVRLCLRCDGTHEETRFRLSAKWTSPFKLAGLSFQLATGSRGVRTCSSIAGYTMFRGSVKSTGYPIHSPFSPSLPLPCVTMCHLISTGLYNKGVHTVFGRLSCILILIMTVPCCVFGHLTVSVHVIHLFKM